MSFAIPPQHQGKSRRGTDESQSFSIKSIVENCLALAETFGLTLVVARVITDYQRVMSS